MADEIHNGKERDAVEGPSTLAAEQARDVLSKQFSTNPSEAETRKAAETTKPIGSATPTDVPVTGGPKPTINPPATEADKAPPLPAPLDVENNPSGATAPKTPAERKAAESVYFEFEYNKHNMQLDPFQKGEGPEQVLIRMNADTKLGKTLWPVEKIHEEAERISRRDLTDGKHAYRIGEQTPLWTPSEITDKVKQTVDRPRGVDISHFDLDIDWKTVKASGVDFAFLKATGARRDGTVAVDLKFDDNRQGAKEAGVALGYYHFFRADVPVDQQVQLFTQTIGKNRDNKLPIVMDVEEDGPKPNWVTAPDGHPYTPKERMKIIDDFCTGVRKALGNDTRIALYVSPQFVNQDLNNDKGLSKYELWNANWKVPEPNTPQPWAKTSFWQYAGDNGKVAGINKPAGQGVDLDMAMDPKVLSKKHK